MASNEREELSPGAIADAAAHLSAVLDLQLALLHIDGLTRLITELTKNEAGRDDRETMMARIRERTDILQRSLQQQLQRDPSMHIERYRARHGQNADESTRH